MFGDDDVDLYFQSPSTTPFCHSVAAPQSIWSLLCVTTLLCLAQAQAPLVVHTCYTLAQALQPLLVAATPTESVHNVYYTYSAFESSKHLVFNLHSGQAATKPNIVAHPPPPLVSGMQRTWLFVNNV